MPAQRVNVAPEPRRPRLLLLLRHAKSAWPQGVADQDRPLAARGEAACLVMGGYLAASQWRPERVVASPAQRTMETAHRVLAVLGEPPFSIEQDDRLYGGDIGAVLAETPPGVGCVLLVGHQPELEMLLECFVGPVRRLATAALAVVELTQWSQASPGRLVDFVTPKDLGGPRRPGRLGVG